MKLRDNLKVIHDLSQASQARMNMGDKNLVDNLIGGERGSGCDEGTNSIRERYIPIYINTFSLFSIRHGIRHAFVTAIAA
jgi:hypothetical protein